MVLTSHNISAVFTRQVSRAKSTIYRAIIYFLGKIHFPAENKIENVCKVSESKGRKFVLYHKTFVLWHFRKFCDICDMENNRTQKEVMFGEIGKYCLDISKLIFGGVILAGIMKLDVSRTSLFIIGGIAVAFTAIFGLFMMLLGNSSKKKEE